MMRLPVIASVLFGLTSCAPALLQTQSSDGVPDFYRLGPADEAVAEADLSSTPLDVPLEPLPAQEPTPDLAPQELADPGAATWTAHQTQTPGPAPRNAISGGVLDVGVVPATPEGTAVVQASAHGLEPSDSGRLYILELYQEVLEQRDALSIEVNGLIAEVERSHAEIARLTGTTQSDSQALASLKGQNDALRQENADLAARLVTAQIRRLEAEKLLLEAKIEAERKKLSGPSPLTGGVALGEEPR